MSEGEGRSREGGHAEDGSGIEMDEEEMEACATERCAEQMLGREGTGCPPIGRCGVSFNKQDNLSRPFVTVEVRLGCRILEI